MNRKSVSLLALGSVFLFLILVLAGETKESAAAPAGSGENLTFLPVIVKPEDLFITGMELSQSVQDESNNVPLVDGRPTAVRVFTATNSGNTAPDTTIVLSATRGGSSLGSISVGPKTASGASSRSSLSSTFNFTLPSSWTSGAVVLTASVSGKNASFTQTFNFNPVPTLNVVIVPIDYTHTDPDTNPGLYEAPDMERISDWMMRAYPLSDMNISFHTDYPFTGNLNDGGGSFQDLLGELRILRQSDLSLSNWQDHPTVYYGYIPYYNGSGQTWFPSSGVVGIGYIGLRVSLGVDLPWGADVAGELAGHEIGHNFGRLHAPCNVSGDDDYPYAGASIGQYGLDGINSGAWSLLSPGAYVDMMSYCDPVWVSDYTYTALYQNQVAEGYVVSADTAVESLLISGDVAADGSVTLEPIYTLVQTPSTNASGAYEVQLLDASGMVLATHPAAVFVAEEPEITVQTLSAIVPMPDEPVAEVRVVEAGTESAVAQRSLTTAAQRVETALAQTATTATLNWGQPDTPAIVRYTSDDGQTWTTVGLDVLGGELTVDLSELPGGGNGRFELILADHGVPTRLQLDLETALPDKQPRAWISGPAIVSAGAPAALYGFASDPEDGALEAINWSVDGEPVQEGKALFVHDLSVGEHVVTISTTDSAGQTVTSSHLLTVTP